MMNKIKIIYFCFIGTLVVKTSKVLLKNIYADSATGVFSSVCFKQTILSVLKLAY